MPTAYTRHSEQPAPRGDTPAPRSYDDLARDHQRLEDLYEISKLFARFDDAVKTLDVAFAVVSRSLPLHSAIVIESADAGARMVVWVANAGDTARLVALKAHVKHAYAYLVGAESGDALDAREVDSAHPLPQLEEGEAPAGRVIVVPLVVADHPPFGALQIEGARELDKYDLKFVSAIANQLAIALDRDRAWRRDIARRDQAEGARGVAEAARARYEALARENAELYEQARRAVEVREQVLAIVSHDLKSPLSTVLLATGMLSKREACEGCESNPSSSLGRIQRSAERMLRLIEDLLDFASIEAGRLAIKTEPRDPGAMIRETLANIEEDAQRRGLHVVADVEPNLPPVSCDRDRVLQVLSNLVGNATKVTPAGGSITLGVEARGREVVFSVADTGPGIDAAQQALLFDRYWRGDEVSYKGTGLGLAIARGLVKSHGGRIWVESEPGHGATFFFSLLAA